MDRASTIAKRPKTFFESSAGATPLEIPPFRMKANDAASAAMPTPKPSRRCHMGVRFYHLPMTAEQARAALAKPKEAAPTPA